MTMVAGFAELPVTYTFQLLHHVQLAMPDGAEERARAFYAGILAMTEIDKPPALATRGGAWFRGGEVEIHLAAEDDFHPARRAHPALLVTGLDDLATRLTDGGVDTEWDDRLPGHRRFYAHDPFGNRLEFLQPA